MTDISREAIEVAQKSLDDLPEEWDRGDWHADSWYCAKEMLEAALPILHKEWNNELRAALIEAIRLIEGLADQQAMPDDWYQAPLARLKHLIET